MLKLVEYSPLDLLSFMPNVKTEEAIALGTAPAASILRDGRAIACGGAAVYWETRAYLWTYLSPDIRTCEWPAITKLTRRFIDSLPYPRLEAATLVEFRNGHRFLKALGFTCYHENAQKFHPAGHACALYEKVR